MTKNGAACAPSKVFWCSDSFLTVHRSIDHKKLEESWKNCKKSIFQAKFAGIGALERCLNLIQRSDFGALWVLGGVLGYANLFQKFLCQPNFILYCNHKGAEIRPVSSPLAHFFVLLLFLFPLQSFLSNLVQLFVSLFYTLFLTRPRKRRKRLNKSASFPKSWASFFFTFCSV